MFAQNFTSLLLKAEQVGHRCLCVHRARWEENDAANTNAQSFGADGDPRIGELGSNRY